MRHPVASHSFICRHRIGIQSGHSFKFDLAFRQPLVPAVFGHKIRKFERAYRIGFADVLPDFSTDILCVQVPNTKTFSHLMRGRGGGNINGGLPFATVRWCVRFAVRCRSFGVRYRGKHPLVCRHRTPNEHTFGNKISIRKSRANAKTFSYLRTSKHIQSPRAQLVQNPLDRVTRDNIVPGQALGVVRSFWCVGVPLRPRPEHTR